MFCSGNSWHDRCPSNSTQEVETTSILHSKLIQTNIMNIINKTKINEIMKLCCLLFAFCKCWHRGLHSTLKNNSTLMTICFITFYKLSIITFKVYFKIHRERHRWQKIVRYIIAGIDNLFLWIDEPFGNWTTGWSFHHSSHHRIYQYTLCRKTAV